MAQVAAKRNWFAISMTAIAVVLVAVVAFVVIMMNSAASSPGTAPQSSIVNADNGQITVGTGEGQNELITYVDFMCPACGQFEASYGEQIQTLAKDGKLKLRVVPVGLLDGTSQGTQYSTRSANAMYCVAQDSTEKSMDFFNALFDKQPSEGTPGLSDKELNDIALSVGAKDITSCQEERPFGKFVAFQTKNMPRDSANRRLTPTVVWDGEYIQQSELAVRLAAIDAK